jgi:eukaryotic-like serine/threonine-protein kinase
MREAAVTLMIECGFVKRCVSCQAVARDQAGACVRCGDPRSVRTEVEVVDDRYALSHRIGAGAMGTVYLAHDVDLAREVAVKLVTSELATRAHDVLQREAVALAAIKNPHVVSVFDFGPHGDTYYFAMEYVRGRTLEDLLDDFRRHGTFVPADRASTIVRQVASGLAAAHAAGIVHRDVKPSNVVIETGSGRPVVVDFGLALRLAEPKTRSVAGTPVYMAPEQALSGANGAPTAGPPADVYGLACTAFELFTNRPPFVGGDAEQMRRMHARDRPPLLSSLRAELAPLDAVIARALAKRPEDRYATCLELGAALKEAGAWRHAAAPHDRSDGLSSIPPAPSALRILVVDDDDAFRHFAKRAAQLAMADVMLSISAVGSGPEAIESARRIAPRLIILDYELPGLDGIATLSALRSLPTGGDAHVLVVTGSARAQEKGGDRWKFGVLGVHDFVDKPVSLPDLIGALEAMALRYGWVKRR